MKYAKQGKKGQIWISAVLYILIAAVAMFLILQMGIPLLNQMRDRSSYTGARDMMVSIDKNVQEVSAEGEGSQRIIPVDIRQGAMIVDNTSQALKWQIQTQSKVIEPRTSVQFGNLKVYTNIDVNTDEQPCSDNSGEMCYILENSRIRAEILKKGNITDKQDIKTSDLIRSITYKGATPTILQGNFDFAVSGKNPEGIAYTEMKPAGTNKNIDRASVTLHMTDQYDLILTLESESDFLKADVKNY